MADKEIKKTTPNKKETTFFQDIQNLYMSADRLTKNTEGYNYKYVQLKDVLSEAKKLCLANNFIFIQIPKVREDGKAILETQLIHKSGEKKIAQTLLPAKDYDDPQKVGGAITYMRRYSLTSILGLEETDDDAVEASKEPVEENKTEKADEPVKKLTNIDKMKQILSSMGAKNKEMALKMVNGCKALSSEIKDMKDITEDGAAKIISALKFGDDEEED